MVREGIITTSNGLGTSHIEFDTGLEPALLLLEYLCEVTAKSREYRINCSSYCDESSGHEHRLPVEVVIDE